MRVDEAHNHLNFTYFHRISQQVALNPIPLGDGTEQAHEIFTSLQAIYFYCVVVAHNTSLVQTSYARDLIHPA